VAPVPETVPKPEIRLGKDAGLVRRGSRTARNEGAVPRPAGRPYAKNLSGGYFERVSSYLSMVGTGKMPALLFPLNDES
jgi:hypothetical protein